MNNHVIPPRQRYGVAGDWHGEIGWIKQAIERFDANGIDVVFQLGDFGLMGDIPRVLWKVEKILKRHGVTVYVVDGNHENHDYLSDPTNFEVDSNGIKWFIVGGIVSRNLALFPRGFSWSDKYNTYLAVGGAASIDRYSRIPNRSWWAGEQITPEDAERIISALPENVDVMFSHEAPYGVPALDRHSAMTADWWDEEDIRYADSTRVNFDRIFQAARPKLAMHGHWHLFADERVDFYPADGEPFRSHIVSLDRDGRSTNLLFLHPETRTVGILPRREGE